MKCTPEQAEIWWNMADVNHDNWMTVHELKSAVNECRRQAGEEPFDDQTLCAMFVSITGCTDASEKISKEKYMEQMGMDRSEDFKRLFKKLDVSGDGCLSHDELKHIIQSQGLKENAAAEIIASADPNNDGKITWQEFKKCVGLEDDD